MQSYAILTEKLTRRFDSFTAVDSLDLCVPYGEIFGLLGPNGAGKTSTIKMLTTLLPPTSGQATVGGSDIIKAQAEVRRKIGYVPQMLSADGALTAHENLMLSARLYDIPRPERKPRIDEALHFMGLSDVSSKLVKTYSGGMIRRLELAQAMLHRPTVLFLDDPSICLDPVARRTVWDRLLDLKKDFSVTILITTHDMEEADHLCGELAIMRQGKIIVIGKPSDLKASIGPAATLDNVFAHYSGGVIQEGGSYRDVKQTRSTANRLG